MRPAIVYYLLIGLVVSFNLLAGALTSVYIARTCVRAIGGVQCNYELEANPVNRFLFETFGLSSAMRLNIGLWTAFFAVLALLYWAVNEWTSSVKVQRAFVKTLVNLSFTMVAIFFLSLTFIDLVHDLSVILGGPELLRDLAILPLVLLTATALLPISTKVRRWLST